MHFHNAEFSLLFRHDMTFLPSPRHCIVETLTYHSIYDHSITSIDPLEQTLNALIHKYTNWIADQTQCVIVIE